MKRRDFLQLSGQRPAIPKMSENKILISSTLEEQTEPLTKEQAYHLLRRVTFSPTYDMVKQLAGKTPAAAVSLLLGDGSDAPPPDPNKEFVDVQEENPLGQPVQIRGEIEANLKRRYRDFCDWWLEQMRTDTQPAREKLTLFLSTVWTIEFTYDTLALIPPPLIYKNNKTLRADRMTDYKTIAEHITLDGAMLLYQSLQYSNTKTANENYMRELLELFTMGIGNEYTGETNYTETDIREGTKALTGWRTAAYKYENQGNDPFATYFSPADHIIEGKTFMGDVIAPTTEPENTEELVLERELRGLLNIMFDKRGESIANFVCNKIYRYFAYSNPAMDNSAIVAEMSDVFVDSGFSLKAVFEALFKSKHFYDPELVGAQIKTPPEFIVSLERQLGVQYAEARDAVFTLDQMLYDPPNVGSWDGYRYWISTKTFPYRLKYAQEMLDMKTDNELVNLAKSFDDYTDADKLTAEIEMYFLPKPLSTERHEAAKWVMLNAAQVIEDNWEAIIEAGNAQAAAGIKALINHIFEAPDFQLS